MHSIVFALRIGEHIYYRGINSGERCTIGGHRKDDLQIEGWQKCQISLQANGGSLSLQSLFRNKWEGEYHVVASSTPEVNYTVKRELKFLGFLARAITSHQLAAFIFV